MELDERIYREICDLSQEGDQYLDDDNFELAEKKYLEALDLIPKPKPEREESSWLYDALGEVYLFSSKYLEAISFLSEALKCPEGLGNPLINL